MSLREYFKKRDFSKTSEPKGKISKQTHRLFIIQKHAASHLHYDFRIELHGVLKSWAIPKGPSLDPKVKRLAMHVEDHPLEYGSFEGIIPQGQYGGGTVMLWDKGIWEPLDDNPAAAYKAGHLRFNLHALKLKGRWDLIRFKDDQHWFLIKHQDEYVRGEADYDITTDMPNSVLKNQSMEEIAQSYTHVWQSDHAKPIKTKKSKQSSSDKPIIVLPKGLKKAAFPRCIKPELATLVDKPPIGAQWLHEIKFDGYRIIAFKNGSQVVLKSRNNNDWTATLPTIAKAIMQLPFKKIVLDGEVVILDSAGRPDFQLLQQALKDKKQASFSYFLFDLLYFEGFDLRHLALIERKAILKNILSISIPSLHYSEHIINEGEALYDYACKYAIEGIVSKLAHSEYQSRRTKDWLKIKCLKRQEFVIGGYTSPQRGRLHFGALLLGVYDEQKQLHFVGKVGTGFNQKNSSDIYQLLLKHKSTANPFNTKPIGFSKAHWVHPRLICEIEFTEWTKGKHLRHPSFKNMRSDKKATEVVREIETPIEDIEQEKAAPKKLQTYVRLTHPKKVLYAEDNITKQDLLTYYEHVSDYILPYLSLRPLTLVRCPSDYQHCFYQRHYNKSTEKALHAIEDKQDEKHEHYIYLNDKNGLLSLVQMGVLEIHPWGSNIHHLNQPDVIVFDLDPAPNLPWSKVVAAAKEVRDHLAQYQLQSFVRTTGGKGLHVVVPIMPEYDWGEVKEFTHVFVQFLEQLKPKEYTSTMSKSKRRGKIFIDYLRNQRTATAIASYSTRARIHAPVSAPLSWEELSDRIEENSYTIKTLPQRLAQLKEDPWKEFWQVKQSLRLDTL